MKTYKFTPLFLAFALFASACSVFRGAPPPTADVVAAAQTEAAAIKDAKMATAIIAEALGSPPGPAATATPAITGTFLPPPTPPVDQTTGAPITQMPPGDAPPDQATCLTEWPRTAEQAAATFGGTADRFFQTAEGGGWQMRERTSTVSFDAKGCLAQGYRDTSPGKNPYTFVFNDEQKVQGATVWPIVGSRANAEWLRPRMVQPVWEDGSRPEIEILIP